MPTKQIEFNAGVLVPSYSIITWRIFQAAVWLAGIVILFCLFFFQHLGILLFWDILIPIAPALFVISPGIWRNVCPLATTNLMPRHFGLSKKKKLSAVQMGLFNLIAVIALFAIVPLRHALFNASGIATAILIISTAAVSIIAGFFYEWKSAWCSGLCPIHPVEKLYGGNVLLTVPNAHCDQCMNCVVPCPDSTPNITPKSSIKTAYHKVSGILVTGGLPGFIWGWFHVPDQIKLTSLSAFFSVDEMPVLGLTISLFLYAVLCLIVEHKFERTLTVIFAAAGVACYYWYRIPALFGFGDFGHDGLLVNLHTILPAWSIFIVTTASTILFFIYSFSVRKTKKAG